LYQVKQDIRRILFCNKLNIRDTDTNTQRSALIFHTFNVLLYMYIRFPHYALYTQIDTQIVKHVSDYTIRSDTF